MSSEDNFDAATLANRAVGGESDGPEPAIRDVDGGEDTPTPSNDDDSGRPTNPSEFGEWMLEPSEMSHKEVDAAEYWDPDEGGRNRFAVIVADYLDSKYPPRIMQLFIGAVEEMIKFFSLFQNGDAKEAQSAEEDDRAEEGGEAEPLTEVESV